MPKKLAIDWDDSELRLVVAQCTGSDVKVTDAALVPIDDGDVVGTLRKAIEARGLSATDTLVAIGRGKAELRDLQLPKVPDDELPDMVRFQAIRTFASAGDSAIVDYLVTSRDNDNISLLAAAVGPSKLNEINKTCKSANLSTQRVALRPLAASALYFASRKSSGVCVLVDLLSDDAEIVIARDGDVFFVRTVRLPSTADARPAALLAELRRSLIACGLSDQPDSVVLWGRESVHANDVAQVSKLTDSAIEVLDPFSLVDVAADVQDKLPDHVGRLAPLVGLLKNDESGAHRLIDFLNPRKRVVKEPNPYVRIVAIAAPILALLLVGFFCYSHLKNLDREIALLKKTNSEMGPKVKTANDSVARTERVDQFLDGDVNWLSEMRRMADRMPPSGELIVRQISGQTLIRTGGGEMTIKGNVRKPETIDDFEAGLRDEFHAVVGDGSKQNAKGTYSWGMNETITIASELVRNDRYVGLNPDLSTKPSGSEDSPTSDQAVTAKTDPDPPAPDPAEETEQQEDADKGNAQEADAQEADTKKADADQTDPEQVEQEKPTSETNVQEEA